MKMRLILTAIVLLPALAGCGGDGSQGETGDRTVAAAFYPLAYAARQLAPPGTEIVNLTPPGVEPHDLELSPQDVQRVRSADLVLLIGHGFQPAVEAAAGSGDRVLELLDTPGLRRIADDPHVWLDPIRYSTIVERIAAALDRPEVAADLVARLGALDREFSRGLSNCPRREIVTSHEAFAFLAQRYDLRQVAITGLSPEAEPTPRRLRRVIDVVRATGATTVFFETLVSPRIAETVARETGARTAVLNPIEGLTPAEAKRGEDYFSLMRTNLHALRTALGCR
jgi:zinc transport system substrate-binding protein